MSKLQMEIIDLQEDVSLKQYRSAITEEFWTKDDINKYSNCKQLAINLATMFVQHTFMRGIIFKN